MKENQSFSKALEAAKKGHRIQRKGWNGKGMWLSYQKGGRVVVDERVSKELYVPVGSHVQFLPFLLMKTADNCYVPWLASQTDLLSDDWNILDK